MIDLFENYPYLGLSSILFISFIIGFVSFPAHRKHMLLSGLLSVPFCLLEFAFIPDYWTPHRLPGFLISPSDLLFSFSTGGMAWLLASGLQKKPFQFLFKPHQFVLRYLAPSFAAASFILCLWLLGMRIMSATLIGMLVGLIVLTGFFKKKISVMLSGAIGFGLFYTLMIKLSYIIWPDFAFQWRLDELWNFRPWGVPLEEILWAVGCGAIWPRFIAYVFGGKLKNAHNF